MAKSATGLDCCIQAVVVVWLPDISRAGAMERAGDAPHQSELDHNGRPGQFSRWKSNRAAVSAGMAARSSGAM